MADGFWSGLTIGDVFKGSLEALPNFLDKPGAPGNLPQSAPQTPPAPVGAATAQQAVVSWFEDNKMYVIGGAVGLVILIVLARGK